MGSKGSVGKTKGAVMGVSGQYSLSLHSSIG